ncbi:MAG TPA: DUF2505 domain-containing protein [Candidatus Competibacteraceae bacterium]|nr:DUF2505 domain-containing protein [Candidatus Competibacteraceae bacterium]
MTFSVEYVYENTAVEELYRLLTSADFLRRKYEGIGSRNLRISECGQDEEVFRVEWRRELRSNPPAFAARFLGEWNALEEIIEWERQGDGVRADYLGKVRGVPGELRGKFVIEPRGQGCVESITLKAVVNIPLLGGKIAQFAEEDARRSLDAEYQFTRQYLAGR